MQHSDSFYQQNALWLSQFENLNLALFDLCSQANFYIVNHAQTVLYWSLGMTALTGLKSDAVLNKPCSPELMIHATEKTDIQLNHQELHKITQVLHTQQNTFGGGIALLQVKTELIKDIKSVKSTRLQNFHGILSRSPAMQDVFRLIENAAETTVTVLVRGESGTGKELVAKAIHDLSLRKNSPFLAINCAALSSHLLESELFGHVRGAFTGAIKDHKGLFQRAHGGTIFLDEVAEMPLELQAKLLRVIQERNCLPVGGGFPISVDVRLIAATHRSLREEVKQGRFREDLMYRLRVVPIFIPPLRERREDISLLIWHFINQHNAENFRRIDKIEPQAMKTLLDHAWLGNVRELQNVVEYAFAVGRGSTLRVSELPPEFREVKPIEQTIKANASVSNEQEAAAIRQALTEYQGEITAAAESLGMSRATFWRKRKRYGL